MSAKKPAGGKGSNQYRSKGMSKARGRNSSTNAYGIRKAAAAAATAFADSLTEDLESESQNSEYSAAELNKVGTRINDCVRGGGDAPKLIPTELQRMRPNELAATTNVSRFVSDSSLASSKTRGTNLAALDGWDTALDRIKEDGANGTIGEFAVEELDEFRAGFYYSGARLMAKESHMASPGASVDELRSSFDGLRGRWKVKKTRQADRDQWIRGMQGMSDARRRGAITAAAAAAGWDEDLNMRNANFVLGIED